MKTTKPSKTYSYFLTVHNGEDAIVLDITKGIYDFLTEQDGREFDFICHPYGDGDNGCLLVLREQGGYDAKVLDDLADEIYEFFEANDDIQLTFTPTEFEDY